ncbi:MAG TPA: FGGY family carbohydrate kinase [Kofleriaceae bacterium]|nr:FGGY family carbohydrate kinase [Kofleriaceae bacterium]
MALLVGIDLGTQSTKAVVCDERLVVLGAGRVAYAPSFPQPGWAEQDSQLWLDALAPAIADALAAAGRTRADVAAIAVTGQLDGMVAVDEHGAALGPCLPWLDRRATAELPALDPARFLAITGQVPDASHLAAKARWWDRTHQVIRAHAFHQPVSFVVEQLCGERVMDPSLASTTMLWDLDASTWSSELCAAFGIEPMRLPSVAPAASVAGALSARGATLAGLPAGIVVAVGTGDDFAAPLGAGLAPGELVCVIGTAEVVGARAATALRDAGRLVETHAYPAGGFFVENPGWLSGGALAWLGALLHLDPEALDAAAASAPPGAGGVAFLPALGGAMTPQWDPDARGAFVGLTPAHGAPHLCRAVYEACAYAMRDVAERIAALGVPLASLRLLGGGARSRAWAGIRADATGLPAALPADVDTAPVGAALCAAVAAGIHPDLATAAAALPGPAQTLAPDPTQRAVHDAGHARYRELATRLRAGRAAAPGA